MSHRRETCATCDRPPRAPRAKFCDTCKADAGRAHSVRHMRRVRGTAEDAPVVHRRHLSGAELNALLFAIAEGRKTDMALAALFSVNRYTVRRYRRALRDA